MIAENHYLISHTGSIYPLTDRGATIRGTGALPLRYETTAGYQQHGQTVKGWRAETRQIRVELSLYAATRNALWTEREKLVRFVSPSAYPLIYNATYPDGRRRAIQCWLEKGPDFVQQGNRAVTAQFSLLCPSASFYDPGRVSANLDVSGFEALAFPFVFMTHPTPDDGFWFDNPTALQTGVAYAGSAREWPTIRITGPFQSIRIANLSTGAFISITSAIPDGDVLTIDLTPGAQRITDQDGVNRLDYLSEGGLIDWYLQPGPTPLKPPARAFPPARPCSCCITTATRAFSQKGKTWHRLRCFGTGERPAAGRAMPAGMTMTPSPCWWACCWATSPACTAACRPRRPPRPASRLRWLPARR
jgi:hypothetical protein